MFAIFITALYLATVEGKWRIFSDGSSYVVISPVFGKVIVGI